MQEDLNLPCLLQMKEKVSGKFFVSPSGSVFLPSPFSSPIFYICCM